MNTFPTIRTSLALCARSPTFSGPPPGEPESHELRGHWREGYHHQPLEHYYRAFPDEAGASTFRLDGSIGYWSTPESAELIHRHLPNAKLVFVFRDPVKRFVSWYLFYRQMHLFPAGTTLAQVVDGLPDHERETELAFSIGKYAERLRPWWERFDHEDILLLRFADLRQDPRNVMARICSFLGLDDNPYDDYDFSPHNPSLAARNPAVDRLHFRLVMGLRDRLLAYPRLFRVVSAVNRRSWEPLYRRLNKTNADRSDLEDEALEKLRRYYRDEASLLEELTGISGLLDD